MDLQKVKKTNKEVMVSIRITKHQAKWMAKNNVAPAKVLDQAINQLIDKQVAQEIADKVNPKKSKKARAKK